MVAQFLHYKNASSNPGWWRVDGGREGLRSQPGDHNVQSSGASGQCHPSSTQRKKSRCLEAPGASFHCEGFSNDICGARDSELSTRTVGGVAYSKSTQEAGGWPWRLCPPRRGRALYSAQTRGCLYGGYFYLTSSGACNQGHTHWTRHASVLL